MPTKLTEIDKMVLRKGATGRPVEWSFRWDCEGKSVTRQVNKLRKAGLINVTYFSGYAYAHPNLHAIKENKCE